MFHNQYSNDVSIFSIDGRILQLEYSRNASNFGQTVLGIKSWNHVIFFTLNSKKELNVPKRNKLFSISKNVGIAMTGIIGDGKSIYQFLEKKNEEYKNVYKLNCPVTSLAFKCSSLLQRNTFHSGSRPYGSKILINGFDSNGPSLFEISTEDLTFETSGTVIGSKSHSINGKFIGQLKKFKESSLDEMIYYSIGIFQEEEASGGNFQIGINGKEVEFSILNKKCRNFYMNNFRRRKKNN
mmetsp:Transcript_40431/g.80991  ORF Transcript_40431/g.80991 Transcript_40431/m.80991 type:complete len:239 (-) Transcript_40431:4027-4743(-)